MKRREKRAAKAKGRHQGIDRVVAVHEAGHAVARFLVAPSLGWRHEEIITSIDIKPRPTTTGKTSLDGKIEMLSQATTFGQFLSRPMHEFLHGALPAPGEISAEEPCRSLQRCARLGSISIGGSAPRASSAFLGRWRRRNLLAKPFEEVWSDYGSNSDIDDIIRAGKLCGMTDEQIEAATDDNVGFAEHYMERPGVWVAILALADSLKPGRMPGRVAAALIERALSK